MEQATAQNQTIVPPRWRRWARRALVLLILAFIGGELFARFYLGLGDPPLTQVDPEIEYLYKPSQTCNRFGNHMHYNQWSMRSGDFPKDRPADELRVLVVGDSIVNGGTLLDDKDLATTILQSELTKKLNRKVIVGNVGAGSWGPENQLAYLKRFGFFGAQVVVFVWSQHDVGDVPEFDPNLTKRKDYPASKPFCALSELLDRYLLPRVSEKLWPSPSAAVAPGGEFAAPLAQCVNAMREQIQMAKRADAKVLVVMHFSQPDFAVEETMGHHAISRLAEDQGVQLLSLKQAIQSAMKIPDGYFRGTDPNHPSAAGQHVMAGALEPAIETLLADKLKPGS
jgi:hypothetical protein